MTTTREDWRRAAAHSWHYVKESPELLVCVKCSMVESMATPLENIEECPGVWTPDIERMNKRYVKP